MTEFKVSEGWEEIPDFDNDLWCPQSVGDEFKGIYLNKKEDVGPNRATIYNLKNEEGEFIVFGTEVLNRKFKVIPPGYEVGIIYRGEKPSKPPKKPLKMFKVFKRAPGSESKKDSVPDVKEEPKKVEMNMEDDSKTWELVNIISTKLEDKHERINEKNITAMALKMYNDPSEDFTKKEFEDVKRVVKGAKFD